jgi:hypothetical protein
MKKQRRRANEKGEHRTEVINMNVSEQESDGHRTGR